MKTSFISSSALSEATRLSLSKLQARLADAQKEVSTGRHVDIGRAIGHSAGQTVSLRHEHARLQTIIDTNGLAATRLDATQAALTSLTDSARSFLDQLVASRNNADMGPQVMQAQARTGLTAYTTTLNTSVNGAYLFAGINADVKPIADYDQTPPAANKQAVANAFMTAFGISQSDPGVANISTAAMQTFLDGPFAGLFDPAAWSATWSSASDQNVQSRIATSELIETSVNANADPIRRIASVFTMVADLGLEDISDGAYHAIVDTASRTLSQAIGDLTVLRANLGTSQERVTRANERMSIQIDIMTEHISALEGVDTYEASTRVADLLTQVETAYAMTARIHKLSILNYL